MTVPEPDSFLVLVLGPAVFAALVGVLAYFVTKRRKP